MALEHGGVVGPVVALVAANGKIVGVRLLHVVPQIGQVGRPVAAGVADQVLALVVHGLELRHSFSEACLQHSQTVIQPCTLRIGYLVHGFVNQIYK